MEEDTKKLVYLANKRYSEIIGEGFKLFAKNYRYLILPFAIFGVLAIFLKILLLTEFELYINELGRSISERLQTTTDISDFIESEFFLLLQYLILNFLLLIFQTLISGRVGGIITTISMCSVSTFLLKKHLNGEADFVSSFKSSFNKRMLLVILVIGIGLPIGIFFLFIPSIIIYNFFIFLVFTYNMKDVENPISEARLIAKGAFWKLIGIIIINSILIATVSFIYKLIIDFVFDLSIINISSTRDYGMKFLYQLLYSTMDIIFAPLLICLLTCFFSKLKAQKDLDSKFIKRYYPARKAYQESHPQLEPEMYKQAEPYKELARVEMPLEGEAIYCHFCSYLIKTPKKFCPNCGKSLIS
ncbi:MAG: hypothetical protein KAT57_05890 [Candidatus Lokiarchaeota archaeon]|nr:hypothetical protein [Candidatus Lokiarchaeota archaeon]